TAQAGDPVTLTAAVSPASAAGTVQFVDVAGASPVNVGAAVAVSGGSASVTTSSLATGARSLQAVFAPANAADFASSTSPNLAYVVTAPPQPATQTSTSLAATPAGTAPAGAPVTLTANVLPTDAVGTVQFTDVSGASPLDLGAAVTVTGGTASLTTSALAVGSRLLRATFVPTSAAVFTASASPDLAYVVTQAPQPATQTSTTISASPAGSAPAGVPVSLTAQVEPTAAAGTVQFSDVSGTTPVAVGAPVPVSGGSASVTTSTLAIGDRQLRATFSPADPAAFAPSTSVTLAFTITAAPGGDTAAPTVTRLTVKELRSRCRDSAHGEFEDRGDRRCGPGALLRARVRPGVAGTVEFFDTVGGVTTRVGDPVTAPRGRARLTVRPLAVGEHTFTAVFTPADPATYQGSTSDAVTVDVDPPKKSRRTWR
ncbi:MAG: Ig-like domain repeat protein, partial [Kineosporiaceae bacterium]